MVSLGVDANRLCGSSGACPGIASRWRPLGPRGRTPEWPEAVPPCPCRRGCPGPARGPRSSPGPAHGGLNSDVERPCDTQILSVANEGGRAGLRDLSYPGAFRLRGAIVHDHRRTDLRHDARQTRRELGIGVVGDQDRADGAGNRRLVRGIVKHSAYTQRRFKTVVETHYMITASRTVMLGPEYIRPVSRQRGMRCRRCLKTKPRPTWSSC